MRFWIFLFLFAIFVTSAFGAASHPPETGLASWYGRRYHGRPTASGELFDMKQLTAAHRTLPFGARLRVTCPSTGRSVVVTINDRGPVARARIIDLSREAASRLGILKRGLERVVLTQVPGKTARMGSHSAD